MPDESARHRSSVDENVARYPLLDALIERRSRRFGAGMRLNGGPLAYASRRQPHPLTLAEEAALAFAACWVTGHALAELPYQTGDLPEADGGNIMTHFVARTCASGDGIHTVSVFIINDEGTWLLKRPQDYPRGEIAELAAAARMHELTRLYERIRIRISDTRVDVTRTVPFVPTFNKWWVNLPGTTYFMCVNECSALYINILLTAFSEEFALFVLDDRNRFRPAGLDRFGRSRGGHLRDDPSAHRFATLGALETWVYEFAAVEQGGILQNLGLMTQALGLGGAPHFAAYPAIWPHALGFRMQAVPFSRTIGAGPLTTRLLRVARRDVPVPTAVGLERDGKVLLKPFCPPYYPTMREAVLAFVDYKFREDAGTYRDGGAGTAWWNGAAVQAGVPSYSGATVAAAIAYCEYVYERYGRFPATNGPFRTVLAYQAHHLDVEFYDTFYRPDALSTTQRTHHDG